MKGNFSLSVCIEHLPYVSGLAEPRLLRPGRRQLGGDNGVCLGASIGKEAVTKRDGERKKVKVSNKLTQLNLTLERLKMRNARGGY